MNNYTPSAVAMLTDFFTTDTIEQTAQRMGFVKRASKITGKSLRRNFTPSSVTCPGGASPRCALLRAPAARWGHRQRREREASAGGGVRPGSGAKMPCICPIRSTRRWQASCQWVEARTNHSHGCEPLLLPVSHPNPSGGSTAGRPKKVVVCATACFL